MNGRKDDVMRQIVSAIFILALSMITVQAQGKGKRNLTSAPVISVVLVSDADGSGTLSHADLITFSINAPAWTQVAITCTQAGTLIYSNEVSQYFWHPVALDSQAWRDAGGGADCLARLQVFQDTGNGLELVDVGATTFAVEP